MKVFEATDPDQVSVFRDIRRQWQIQLKHGNFYAEGEQVILRLLQSRVKPFSLLIAPEYLERWRPLIASIDDPKLSVWVAEKKWMEESTAQRLNQACLAIGRVPEMPPLQSLVQGGAHCLVALEGIDHAVNVGAIMRNCAAFGVDAVLVDAKCSSPYSWRSIRTSLGGVFHVPVYSEASLMPLLRNLRNQKIEMIAVDPEGHQSISDFDFTAACCFIFGSEHRGISDDILNLASFRIAIPHSAKVDSLNVAAASAIILNRSSETRSSLRSQSQRDP